MRAVYLTEGCSLLTFWSALFCGAGDVAPPADLPSGMEVPARFDDVPEGVLFGVPAVLKHKFPTSVQANLVWG